MKDGSVLLWFLTKYLMEVTQGEEGYFSSPLRRYVHNEDQATLSMPVQAFNVTIHILADQQVKRFNWTQV